jgi:hypothetical protein
MGEETVFLRQGDITISNVRAIIGNKTYAMANITSVSLHKIPAKRKPGILWAIIGFFVMIGGFAGGSPGVGVLGLIILALGVWVAYSKKDFYTVHIGSSSGEADALKSKDGEYIKSIVTAINEAIIKRG